MVKINLTEKNVVLTDTFQSQSERRFYNSLLSVRLPWNQNDKQQKFVLKCAHFNAFSDLSERV